MSDLTASVAHVKAGDLLAVRITEGNLGDVVRYFGNEISKIAGGGSSISRRGERGHVGETIVFSNPGGIVGIYDDQEFRRLFKLTGEKRQAHTPWPTDPFIIINDGYDFGGSERIEPGTVALLDEEGCYYTQKYGFICEEIDSINDWTPFDPHKGAP